MKTYAITFLFVLSSICANAQFEERYTRDEYVVAYQAGVCASNLNVAYEVAKYSNLVGRVVVFTVKLTSAFPPVFIVSAAVLSVYSEVTIMLNNYKQKQLRKKSPEVFKKRITHLNTWK